MLVEAHVHAKFHQDKRSSSRVIVWIIVIRVGRETKKISDDAENNTDVATAGSNDKAYQRVSVEEDALAVLGQAPALQLREGHSKVRSSK